jgi:DNA-binding PadR family transcriptional regulator
MGLAILAVLTQQPMHPYEIASSLRATGKDQDMEIKWGSLYTVVANLEKHGLIDAVESSRQGKRPERTVYRITDAGRTELVDWTSELIGEPQHERPRFKAGLSVIGVLPPADAIRLLNERKQKLEAEVAQAREALAGYAGQTPRLFLVEAEYELAIREAEARWTGRFVAELEAGTFPDLRMWQEFHDKRQQE